MIRINSIYDDYDLYSIILGRGKDVKSFEALNSVIAAERLIKARGTAQPLRIIELFAGKSEHKAAFLDHAEFEIGTYDCLDNAVETNGVTVQHADALTCNFPGYDLAIAHFYSLGCPMVRGTRSIERRHVVQHLTNVARNLKSDRLCGYYIHLGDVGLGNTLNQVLTVADETGDDEQAVRPNHPIRRRFGLDPYVSLSLYYLSHTTFDRWTRTLVTEYRGLSLVCEGQMVACWEIRDPFAFRTWSEDEVVDMLREAGFDNAMFFHNSRGRYADNSEHSILSDIIQPHELDGLDQNDEDETEAFNATEILALIGGTA